MSRRNKCIFLLLILGLANRNLCDGFRAAPTTAQQQQRSQQNLPFNTRQQRQAITTTTTTSNKLALQAAKFSYPTQDESVELGIREWPQQIKTERIWSEHVKEGKQLVRYILQGSGKVTVLVDRTKEGNDGGLVNEFNTGVLVEVDGPAELVWIKSDTDDDDIIILTPTYEQSGLFIGAIAGFVVLCGGLIGLT